MTSSKSKPLRPMVKADLDAMHDGIDIMGGGGAWCLHEAIINQAQDAIIFVDRDGIIRLWNRGAEIIFGFSASEAIGHGLDMIIPEKLRLGHEHGFRHAISTGQSRYDGRVMTTRANHKFGSRLYVDLSFGMVKDASGAVAGVFAIGRDSTARQMESAARRVLAESRA